jgi:hypothetical protein
MRQTGFCRALVAVLLTGACSSNDLTLPTSGGPAELHIVSGDGQRAEAGALLPDPIEVRVLDATGRPSAGATVVFGFVDEVEGAAIDPALALTDEQGRAAAVVRLGESPGEQLIAAEVADTDVPDLRARFTAMAIAPDDDDGGGKGKKGDTGKGGEKGG